MPMNGLDDEERMWTQHLREVGDSVRREVIGGDEETKTEEQESPSKPGPCLIIPGRTTGVGSFGAAEATLLETLFFLTTSLLSPM